MIAPLIFASIDLPQYNSVVFPFLQHYVTLGGDDARRDVHYTSIKSAFLTRLPNLIYTIVEPQVIVDHERADKVGLFGDNLPQVYDWKFEVGVRFFLK